MMPPPVPVDYATISLDQMKEMGSAKFGLASSSKSLKQATTAAAASTVAASVSRKSLVAGSDGGGGSIASAPAYNDSSSSAIDLSSVMVDFAYMPKLRELHDFVGQWVKQLTSENPAMQQQQQQDARKGGAHPGINYVSFVKRIMLDDIMRLCLFFGQEATVTLLLPHLLMFFNDQDWELRHDFWSRISAVCLFLGPALSSAYILPGVETAFVDVEDRVVLRALAFLRSLVELQLLSKRLLVGYFTSRVAPALLLHPTPSVRWEAIELTAAAGGCHLLVCAATTTATNASSD